MLKAESIFWILLASDIMEKAGFDDADVAQSALRRGRFKNVSKTIKAAFDAKQDPVLGAIDPSMSLGLLRKHL